MGQSELNQQSCFFDAHRLRKQTRMCMTLVATLRGQILRANTTDYGLRICALMHVDTRYAYDLLRARTCLPILSFALLPAAVTTANLNYYDVDELHTLQQTEARLGLLSSGHSITFLLAMCPAAGMPDAMFSFLMRDDSCWHIHHRIAKPKLLGDTLSLFHLLGPLLEHRAVCGSGVWRVATCSSCWCSEKHTLCASKSMGLCGARDLLQMSLSSCVPLFIGSQ